MDLLLFLLSSWDFQHGPLQFGPTISSERAVNDHSVGGIFVNQSIRFVSMTCTRSIILCTAGFIKQTWSCYVRV